MPAAHKGVRIQQTIRLPASLHRAAAGMARERHWSLNEYITHCVAETVAAAATLPVPAQVGDRQNLRIYDDDGNMIGHT